MFRNKTIRVFGALLFAIAALFLIPAAQGEAGQKTVVMVNETALTQRDLDAAISKIIPVSSIHRAMEPVKREKYRDQAIKAMVEEELIYQFALGQGMKADKKVVKEARNRTIKKLGGRKAFKAALKQAELTDKKYRRRIEKTLLVTSAIKAEVTDKSAISDEEAMAFYERNKEGYMRPSSRRIRHILISVNPSASKEQRELKRARAAEALQKIRDGEDMASVAWDYSDDPYRVKGGDMGLLHKGQMVVSLEEPVFALKAGQLSEIIETIYGFHVVRVEEVREPEQLVYEDVVQRIKRKQGEKKRSRLKSEFIARLRADARVEVMER